LQFCNSNAFVVASDVMLFCPRLPDDWILWRLDVVGTKRGLRAIW